MKLSRRPIPSAIFLVLLGAAGAAGATPDDFDPDAAIERVYGALETKGDARYWAQPEHPDTPMQVSVLGVLPFRQDGAERTFLITQLVPQIEGGFQCHPCAPGIGAATFTKTAEGWRLDVGTPLVTEIGSYGEAPKPDIVPAGPERYAVVFESGGVGQGYHGRLANYFLETDAGVKEALQLQTYWDNSGACDPESGSDVPEDEREGGSGQPCWAYTSKLEFLPGENPDYFDLKVTGTGPQEGQFDEETLYEVVDGAYQLTHKRTVDYRMVPHPVSGVELPRISLAERPAVEQAVNEHLELTAADMRCLSDTPAEDQEYSASVEVTYADNDVLSISIHANAFCGGAHPMIGANFSVTFDLLTGRPVRFRELFEDYERDAAEIAEAYVASLSAGDFEGCEDVFSVGNGSPEEGTIAEEDFNALEMYGFSYTLSPQGVVIQPVFPHVIVACAHPSTVPFERVLELASKEGILMRVADAAR